MSEGVDRDHLRRELAKLTEIHGVSGHEQDVVRYLRDAMTPLADRVEIDAMGNLYAVREGGSAPHLMVEAHSDEIGALVAAIENDGFVRFELVGGVGEAVMIGRKVRLGGHLGVVGIRPGHLQAAAEARSVPSLPELYIDMGEDSRTAVEALGVRVGDPITWESELQQVGTSDRVAGKAVDNRIGCLLLLELLRALQGEALPGKITMVVAVQEEVGLKGARVAAERTRPDRALVVDTTPCPDTPDSHSGHTFPVRLGRGPVIQVASGPHASGFILSQGTRDYLVRLADDAGIPYQLAVFAYGNTDAAAIYSAAGGIPTAVASLPRRYSHSPVEMLDLNDAAATLRLCEEVVRHIDSFPGAIL